MVIVRLAADGSEGVGRRSDPPQEAHRVAILAVRGASGAWHRDGRGAAMARRDNREYRTYLRAEQRRQRGCIARRMQRHLHHGLPGRRRSHAARRHWRHLRREPHARREADTPIPARARNYRITIVPADWPCRCSDDRDSRTCRRWRTPASVWSGRRRACRMPVSMPGQVLCGCGSTPSRGNACR